MKIIMRMMNVNKLCWWVHVLLWSYPGATNMMSSYQVLPSLFTPAVSWVCEDLEEQGGWWNTVTRAMPTLAPDHSISMTRIRGNKALSEIIVDGVIKLSENLGREAAVDGKETSVIFVESSVLHRSLRTLWNQRRVPSRRYLSPRKTSIIRLSTETRELLELDNYPSQIRLLHFLGRMHYRWW